MRESRRAGFTLLELIISGAILGIILVFAFGTMLATHRKAEAIDQTVAAQQSSRAVSDLLERDLRHAGFLVPGGAALCGLDSKTAPDTVFVSDYDAIRPSNGIEGDLGARITGAINPPGSGVMVTVDKLVIEEVTPDPAYDTNGDGTPDSDFQVQGGVIVVDAANPGRGTACGSVVAVTLPNRIGVDLTVGGLGPVPMGGNAPRITLVPAHQYAVNANAELYRGRYLLANDVDDLQLAYFFDLDGDNVVDPNEYRGDGVGPDYQAQGADASLIREVRMNLVVRTRNEDVTHPGGQSQATENRAAVATNDGFRRRVYTSISRLRNLGRRSSL